MYWFGQALGMLAMAESFFIYQCHDRKKMIALKLVDDVLWTLHFFLIGGYTATLTTGIAIIRELIFFQKGRKPWASSVLWAFGFSAIFAACAPLTWEGPYSLLPVVTSIASTWVFWINKTSLAKLILLPSTLCMLGYSIVFTSYSGILTQIVSIASIVVYFVKPIIGNKLRSRNGKKNIEKVKNEA